MRQIQMKVQGRMDLMQKAPFALRRRIHIRREGANGDRNRNYDKILVVFENFFADFRYKVLKTYEV